MAKDVAWLTSTDGLCRLLLAAVVAADVILFWPLAARWFNNSAWGGRLYMWRQNRRIGRDRKRRWR